jgi:hypothetical protein
MTRQRFTVAAAMIGLAVLTIVLYFTSLGSLHAAPIDSFQRTGDPRKIVVSITIGLGNDIAERTVREDATSVTVIVGVRQSPGSYPAIGFSVPVLVSLKEPLGDRAVLDAAGQAVRDVGDIYHSPGTNPRP